MTAREEILGRVRAALAGAEPAGVPPPAPRLPERPAAEVVDRFAERVADYRATVTRCAAGEVAAAVAAALPEGARVVVPGGLSVDLGATGLLPLPDPTGAADPGRHTEGSSSPPDRMTSGELDRVDGVVTDAAVGIAETGTVVLDHGPGQGRRALTLVPDRHVCVVRADQVVPDVADALALLDPARPTTWISGPSATSDIELSRVEGVHGPRTLHVVLVEAETGAEPGGSRRSPAESCGVLGGAMSPGAGAGPPVMDTIDFRPATDELARLVTCVRDDQLGDPTPCTRYAIADLVEHIGGLAVAFTFAARKTPMPPELLRDGDGDQLESGWRDRTAQRLAALAEAWSDPAAYGGSTAAGPIEMPGSEAALVALDEVVVHGWDLAVATGRELRVSDEDARACAGFVASFPAPEGDGPFGPPLPVPEGASELDRLVALTGRDPAWRPA